MMVERPGTLSAASSSADFTWAEATWSRCSIGKGVRAPLSVTGRSPPSRASATAPNSANGSSTRRIGRRCSEASPVKIVVMGVVATSAHGEADTGARIAEIEHVRRLAGTPRRRRHGRATRPRRSRVDIGAQAAHRFGGVEHVVGFEQARYPRLAHGQRAQDERAVRHRLVAGRGHRAFERAALAGGQRGKLACFIHCGTSKIRAVVGEIRANLGIA